MVIVSFLSVSLSEEIYVIYQNMCLFSGESCRLSFLKRYPENFGTKCPGSAPHWPLHHINGNDRSQLPLISLDGDISCFKIVCLICRSHIDANSVSHTDVLRVSVVLLIIVVIMSFVLIIKINPLSA